MRKIKAPDSALGQKIRCPFCETVQVMSEDRLLEDSHPVQRSSSHSNSSSARRRVAGDEKSDSLASLMTGPSVKRYRLKKKGGKKKKVRRGIRPRFVNEHGEVVRNPEPEKCEECGAIMPPPALLCGVCGWQNPNAAPHPNQTPFDRPVPEGRWEALTEECWASIGYAFAGGKALLALSLIGTGLFLVGLLFFFVAHYVGWSLHLKTHWLQWLLYGGGVYLVLTLTVGGYFSRYFLTCVEKTYADEEQEQAQGHSVDIDAPRPLPPLHVVASVKTGAIMLGHLVCYVLPIYRIPMLPLGLLGWSFAHDWRMFDAGWARHAVRRRPGILLMAWLPTWIYSLGAALVVYLAVILTNWLNKQFEGPSIDHIGWWALQIPAGVLGVVLASAIKISFFRCVGLLGRYGPEFFESLADRDNTRWLAGNVVLGAIVAGVLGTLLIRSLDPPAPMTPDQADAEVVAPQEQTPAYVAPPSRPDQLNVKPRKNTDTEPTNSPTVDDSAAPLPDLPDAPPQPQYDDPFFQYLSTVLASRDHAKLAVSQGNLKSISSAVQMHLLSEGRYPETLTNVAGISPATLQSPGDSTARFVYCKPTSASPPGQDILVLDPVPYPGNRFAVMYVSGAVAAKSRDDVLEQLDAQQDRMRIVKHEDGND
jgi:hypothetical protein